MLDFVALVELLIKELDMVWALVLLMVLLLVGAVWFYLFSLPADYTISHTIVIAKPVDQVFQYLVDLNNWKAWSPWHLHDSEAVTSTTNGAVEGGVHTWNGFKMGTGQMEHLKLVSNDRAEILLTCFRPFKSKSNVVWQVTPTSQGGAVATEVSWSTKARMPLLLRPIKKTMVRMISYDFQLGLALLRGQLDPTSEHPKIAFEGVQQRASQLYVTERFEGPAAVLYGVVRSVFPRRWYSYLSDQNKVSGEPAVALFHRVNHGHRWVVMDMGLPVTSMQAGEATVQLPAGRYFVMRLTGSHEFLSSAWNTMYGQIKMLKLKIDKYQPTLEVYTVNPLQARNSNDWVTHLCVPLR
jgi:uncharacterized protein YndB with AHSA1/START domain